MHNIILNMFISIVVGPAIGNINSLFEKVKALDAKYGKFEFALCLGDFFGPASDENDAQIEDLLASRSTGSSSSVGLYHPSVDSRNPDYSASDDLYYDRYALSSREDTTQG
jgi:hypothetical protein